MGSCTHNEQALPAWTGRRLISMARGSSFILSNTYCGASPQVSWCCTSDSDVARFPKRTRPPPLLQRRAPDATGGSRAITGGVPRVRRWSNRHACRVPHGRPVASSCRSPEPWLERTRQALPRPSGPYRFRHLAPELRRVSTMALRNRRSSSPNREVSTDRGRVQTGTVPRSGVIVAGRLAPPGYPHSLPDESARAPIQATNATRRRVAAGGCRERPRRWQWTGGTR